MSEPLDPRVSLANERTLLSWMRCALALVAVSSPRSRATAISRSRSLSPAACSRTSTLDRPAGGHDAQTGVHGQMMTHERAPENPSNLGWRALRSGGTLRP